MWYTRIILWLPLKIRPRTNNRLEYREWVCYQVLLRILITLRVRQLICSADHPLLCVQVLRTDHRTTLALDGLDLSVALCITSFYDGINMSPI